MITAAVSGTVDFNRADPRDRQWWVGLRLRLNELERREQLAALRDQLMGMVGVLARSNWTSQSDEQLKNNNRELLRSIYRQQFPWLEKTKESITTAAESMRTLWVGLWGDPESEETKAEIARTVAAMEQLRRKPVPHG